jgi:hypothetical protein
MNNKVSKLWMDTYRGVEESGVIDLVVWGKKGEKLHPLSRFDHGALAQPS